MQKNIKDSATYKVPICLTLAGQGSEYDEPCLMMAIDERIRITVELYDTEQQCDQEIVATILEECLDYFPDASKVRVHIQSDHPIEYDGVKAAVIVGVVACLMRFQGEDDLSVEDLQGYAYAIERSMFKKDSHAQVVPCIHGGLIFYRKEFEFHKSVFKIPAKFPDWDNNTWHTIEKKDGREMNTAKYIRQLIFSVTTENQKMFMETIDMKHSNIRRLDSISEIQEAHDGITV